MITKTLKVLAVQAVQAVLAINLGHVAPAQAAVSALAVSPDYISPGIAGAIMAWLALFQ